MIGERYIFANPDYFYLLILIPFFIIWYIWRQKTRTITFKVSSIAAFKNVKPSLRLYLRHSLFVLRLLAYASIVVALARPQTSSSKETVNTEGIDIVLAIDVSTSMLAEDLKPNRIEAAKKYALQFIENRINDRMGLVVFSGESFTQCPVTIDHTVLKSMFKSIQSGMIEDGTAIGMGLATAVTRLKDSKAKSKVIILLTDGVNNMGFVAPATAADIAKTYNIRVYTIGVGTKGMAPYPFDTPFGKQYRNVEVQIDEEILKEISKKTNGKYFRATNNKSLEDIYNEINKLETTKVDIAVFSKKTDHFRIFALLALGLFLFEILLRYIAFKTLP